MAFPCVAARFAAASALAALMTIDPALAGGGGPGVPAPLVGAGIPALGAIAAGYWALRKRRRN